MPYVGSFGAGVITATWQPGNPDYLVKGYQSAVTQAWVGSLINVLGEFAPEISRKLRKNKMTLQMQMHYSNLSTYTFLSIAEGPTKP
jgi:hypothetical protein